MDLLIVPGEKMKIKKIRKKVIILPSFQGV